MVTLKHDSDKCWFNVFISNTYIGRIWCRADSKWIFEADLNKIPDNVLSDIEAILRTLNL